MTQINFNCEKKLADRFKAACKKHGVPASLVLRWMMAAVAANPEYLNEIFERGNKND